MTCQYNTNNMRQNWNCSPGLFNSGAHEFNYYSVLGKNIANIIVVLTNARLSSRNFTCIYSIKPHNNSMS